MASSVQMVFKDMKTVKSVVIPSKCPHTYDGIIPLWTLPVQDNAEY